TSLHDVTLSGLRRHFEILGIAENWTSDVEMKRELSRNSDKVVPDGLFVTKIFGKEAVVAFEVELHPKSHRRYRQIFKDYSYRSAISHVFYVARTKEFKKPIFSSWVEIRKFLRFKADQL